MTDSEDSLRRELDELLSERIEHAREREATTFSRAAGDRATSLVLFGAGGLGRRTLAGLRAAGVEPLAFSDNRASLWNTTVDGLPVLSPAGACAKYGKYASFVVTIWGAGSSHRLAHSVAQLTELGGDVVLPVAWLYWRYSDQLLPFYALDLPSRLLAQAGDVRRCYELLADYRSRQEYLAQVRWRLEGDPGGLSHPVEGAQYLVTDVAQAWPGDVVLDCGAYDGDTLRSWLAERGPSFRAYLAMEPDPISRAKLSACLSELPAQVSARVRVLPYSLAGYTGTTTFAASGSLSSRMGDQGGDEAIAVQCISLDDLEEQFGDDQPSFVKIDIEGAELDALNGGVRFLQRLRPMLTIAAYHVQDHLWRVPLRVNEICPTHRLFLRPHNEEGWDLILYAVPTDRVPAS